MERHLEEPEGKQVGLQTERGLRCGPKKLRLGMCERARGVSAEIQDTVQSGGITLGRLIEKALPLFQLFCRPVVLSRTSRENPRWPQNHDRNLDSSHVHVLLLLSLRLRGSPCTVMGQCDTCAISCYNCCLLARVASTPDLRRRKKTQTRDVNTRGAYRLGHVAVRRCCARSICSSGAIAHRER